MVEAANRPNSEVLKALSIQDFLAFGVNQIAYIKPVIIDGSQAWSIHAADGRPLSVMETADEAVAISWHNDLKPVMLH